MLLNNVRLTLPRSQRALQGWSRLVPPGQRLPMPKFMAYAIAGMLALRSQSSMAVWILLTFAAYLRPSESMRLVGRSLVPPVPMLSNQWGLIVNDAFSGVAGKTGLTDESVMISDGRLFPVLESLKRTRGPEE
eukprot:2730343-Karenia_brevis.AAC.1